MHLFFDTLNNHNKLPFLSSLKNFEETIWIWKWISFRFAPNTIKLFPDGLDMKKAIGLSATV